MCLMTFPPSPPPCRSPRRGAERGFTLIELLAVIALVTILTVVAVPSLGQSGSQKFTRNLSQIAGILEQARSAAVGQGTYVWVVFYPMDPSSLTPPDNSGEALYVATFISNDGSNPFVWNGTGWNGSVTMPAGQDEATVAGSNTSVKTLLRLELFKQTAIRTEGYFTQGSGANQIDSLPESMPDAPTPPAASPLFTIAVRGSGVSFQLPAALPSGGLTAQTQSVIIFAPNGAARISGSPIDSIWIDFQRVKAPGVYDTQNIACIKINGLTGLTTLYRK